MSMKGAPEVNVISKPNSDKRKEAVYSIIEVGKLQKHDL